MSSEEKRLENLWDDVDDYRECVEGRMGDISDRLANRNVLLMKAWKKGKKDMIAMIRGGDKYLKQDLNVRKSVRYYPRGGGVCVTLSGLPKDLLKIFKEITDEYQEGGGVDPQFEAVVRSLQDIYNLPEDILECSVWVEDGKLIFDTG